MQPIKDRLLKLKERWTALSLRSRILLLTGLGALVAIGIVAYTTATATTNAVLFSNLSVDDASAAVARLGDLHVPYELTDGGTTILVPEAQVYELRLTLAGEGLPSGGGVGFEVFDEQRFGESEFSERVKYHRALEGELARTIGHISGVEAARVHLVLPQRTLFTSEAEQASASVALRLRPGAAMGEDRVRGIVHLVASSVRGLAAENVTVVDGNGRELSARLRNEEDGPGADDAFEYRERIEDEKARAVQEILDRTLGRGKSIVRVAADVSFTREESTEERFDPEGVAPRSFQIDEERDGSAEQTAAGVPGSVSNLPGGPTPESTTSREGVVRRSETRNFEVSKVVRRAVEPVGRVQRVQVAVVVDGTWTGEGAARTFSPRSEEELAQIRQIVASAVGTDEERGDRVTVECVPFAEAEELPIEEVDLLLRYQAYLPYAAGLLALLILGPIAFVMWRKRKKSLVPERGKTATMLDAKELPSGDAPLDAKSLPSVAEIGKRDGSDNDVRMLSAEVAERDPEIAARVVRLWLSEGRLSLEGAETKDKEKAA
jgi:flagellar M-ring protein FliF